VLFTLEAATAEHLQAILASLEAAEAATQREQAALSKTTATEGKEKHQYTCSDDKTYDNHNDDT